VDRLICRLVFWQRLWLVGPAIRQCLKLLGTDIDPRCLAPGHGLVLPHGGKVVVHAHCHLGQGVTIFQYVTIGRADVRLDTPFGGVTVGDGALIGAGAAVLGKADPIVIGARAVIGANSVLTHSIGADEVWAGNPARRVG
jgi:serine O-acetyltransferase